MSPDVQTALRRIRIASPCPADWAQMRGDGATRHCDLCRRRVHDLDAMSEAQIARVLQRAARGERTCVRLYRRADGKAMTADCTHTRREARRGWTALVAGLFAGLLALIGQGGERGNGAAPWWERPAHGDGEVLMGDIAPEHLMPIDTRVPPELFAPSAHDDD